MFARVSLLTAALATSVCSVGQAFVTPRASTHSALTRAGGIFSSGRLASSVSPRTATASGTFHRGCFEPRMSAQIDIRDLCLTPVLEQMTKAFSMAPTPRTRHEQLLAMGGSAAKMAPEYKTEENKVQGCLSQVFVAAEVKNGLVYFTIDSDSMLTKGLAAVLAEGLSGNSPEAIQAVKPYFVKMAGLSTSLTAGRTNGFLNMLKTMKFKAKQLEEECARQAAGAGQTDEGASRTPMADQIKDKLQELEPLALEVEDESGGEESKLVIYVVSKAFEGLNSLKRHRTVYGILAEEVKVVHAVTLLTKTPEEAGL